MSRVQGVDHIVLSVSDFAVSKAFYGGLFAFLGFEIMDEFPEAMGWSNGSTRLWIYQADKSGLAHPYRKGDPGFHHYAWSLRNRKDVDELQTWLRENDVEIVDAAGEYYPDYYAVFFLDPDGMKLEGMYYGK
ncbi:glyoxalase [[Pantoea] beijingensis]|uniref:Glyoxalase n=1 Tax=[Pantoea] beijingensis TaxID=1324864 RepID=A0A443IHU5_9GAMM|nr:MULTISPECIES: VOC family protein [Erwiniaceae]RWR03589.1 glyoxalase [[Pantoea] beijingensis]